MTRLRVVIQARVGSSRLPGKILAPLAGRTLLAHVAARLQAAAERAVPLLVPESLAALRTEVIVATTTAPADDATAELCRLLGIRAFRGPEDDVLARYVAATADLADGDVVVRATADNPLYCPQRSAAIIAEHVRQGVDYTSIENLSYVVPEAMQAGALRRMSMLAGDAYCREHVTPYFRRPPHEFRVLQLPPYWRGLRPELRLTVDTPAELAQMARVFAELAGGELSPRWDEVYEFFVCQERRAAFSVTAPDHENTKEFAVPLQAATVP